MELENTIMIKAELINYMGSDLTVVNAARVSFAKESNWEEGELNAKDTRLVHYLAEHEHHTPNTPCLLYTSPSPRDS